MALNVSNHMIDVDFIIVMYSYCDSCVCSLCLAMCCVCSICVLNVLVALALLVSTNLLGLQLRLKGSKHQAFASYTYAVTPFMEAPVRVDWKKILTTEGVECQHILCHELQKDDDISLLASRHRKALAVALVLINTNDSLDLPPEFEESDPQIKQSNWPVILISSTDGQSLREYLTRHDPGEIHAKIYARNSPQVEFSRSWPFSKEGSHSPTPSTKSAMRHKKGVTQGVGFTDTSGHVCACMHLNTIIL